MSPRQDRMSQLKNVDFEKKGPQDKKHNNFTSHNYFPRFCC